MVRRERPSGDENSGHTNREWRFSLRNLLRRRTVGHPVAQETPPYLDSAPIMTTVVSDEHRTASKPPVLYDRNDSNVLVEIPHVRMEEIDETYSVRKRFTLKEGTRIVVDGIPYWSLQTGEIRQERSLQIYRNQEGFLVADKVIEGELDRRPAIRLEPTGVERQYDLIVDTDARPERSMNDQKIDFDFGDHKLIQLTSTTYDYPSTDFYTGAILGRHGGYIEVKVYTPDDVGDEVEIVLEQCGSGRRFPVPIAIREVSDQSSANSGV